MDCNFDGESFNPGSMLGKEEESKDNQQEDNHSAHSFGGDAFNYGDQE